MKHEAGTPKDIAKKMKSKGLQKLRWYCQMCEKQCRDENGFKCHIMSESHSRQMKLIGSNTEKFVGNFSRQFSGAFLDLLSKRFGTRRVNANHVYQEFIRDKNHVHMNSTRWHSLTDFVMWLGKESLCHVEETDKGWFITWIDNSPETIAKRDSMNKKAKIDNDSEKLEQKMIEKQIERATAIMAQQGKSFESNEADKVLIRNDENDKIALKLNISSKKPIKDTSKLASTTWEYDVEKDEPQKYIIQDFKKSAAFEIIQSEASKKHLKPNNSPFLKNWLHPNIIVKILNRKLMNGKYYNQKGLVKRVIDDFIGEIEMIDSKDVIRIDQDDCETVIPNIGKTVMIVNGPFRSLKATLNSIDADGFKASLTILEGSSKGDVITLEYEHFSKCVE